MYKTELIKQIARSARVSQPVARRSLNAALAAIQGSLMTRESVILPGFGTFYTRTWPGGRVLDFVSGNWKQLGPKPTASFRAGAVTKRLVAAGIGRRGRPLGSQGRHGSATNHHGGERRLMSVGGFKQWLHRPRKGSKSS